MSGTRPAQFKIRLSPSLREWIAEQARINGRSQNGEIGFRLELARLGVQSVPSSASGLATGEPAKT